MRVYEELPADPDVLHRNQWPHDVDLLHAACQSGCTLGLATRSCCSQVRRVLGILDLMVVFDFVASRDDMERGKPDPKIYRLVAIVDDPATLPAVVQALMSIQAKG